MPPATAAPEDTEEDIKPTADAAAATDTPPDAPETEPKAEEAKAPEEKPVASAAAADQFQPEPDRRRAEPVMPYSLPEDNPDARHLDVYAQVDKQAEEAFNREHPFAPSTWQPGTAPEVYERAARQSDIEAQRQAHADRLARNADLEAQMRGSSQRFYTDPYGNVQPVMEEGTGKPLYNPTTKRERGTNPQTGEPAWMTMDKYGQTQYQRPNLVANPQNPHDGQLYYDFGNGQQEPAGKVEDLLKSSDFKVQRAALKAVHASRAAKWKESLAPMQELASGTASAFNAAKVQHDQIGAQIEQLQSQADSLSQDARFNETTGGVMGFGAKPSDAALQLQAQHDALQNQIESLGKQRDEVGEQIKPTGSLAVQKRDAQMHLAMFKAKASYDNYADLAQERRAILKAQGKPETDDPTLQSILQAQMAYQGAIGKFGSKINEPKPAGANAPPPADDASQAPAGFQGEPYQLAAKGVKGVGDVPVQNLARLYGSGQGEPKPAALLAIKQRIGEIADTLADKNTTLAPKVRDGMQQESDYLNSLFTQRFAKIGSADQRKINAVLDRQNIGAVSDTARRFAKGVVEAPGQIAAGTGRLAEGAQKGIVSTLLKAYEAQHGKIPEAHREALVETVNQLVDQAESRGGASPGSLIKGGEAIKGIAGKIPVNPNRDDTATGTLARTAGNIVGALPAAAAGLPGAVLAGSGMMREQTRDQALASGDSKELADAKGNMAALAGGALGLVPSGQGFAGKTLTAAAGRVALKGLEGAGVNAAADIALQKASTGKIDWQQAAQQAEFGGIFGALFSLPDAYRGRAQARIEEASKAGKIDPDQAQKIVEDERAKAESAGASLKAPEEALEEPKVEPGAREAIEADQPPAKFVNPEELPKRVTEPTKAGAVEDNSTAPSKLTAETDTIAAVRKMGADEFSAYAEPLKGKGGFSTEADRVGLAVKDDPEAMASLRQARDEAESEAKQALAEKRLNDSSALGSKAQFFREAIEAATGTGSAAHDAAAQETSSPSASTGDKTQTQSPKPDESGPTAKPLHEQQAEAIKTLADAGYTVKDDGKFSILIDASGKQVREGEVPEKAKQAFADYREARLSETKKSQEGQKSPITATERPNIAKRFSVGEHPSGGEDILNTIEQYGGVQTRSGAKNPGGEHDDLASTFTGRAKLLLRKSGMAPDKMAQILHADGLIKDGSVGAMNEAVAKALSSRSASAKSIGAMEESDRFERAFLGNEQGKKYLRAKQPISINDLAVGDKFEVNGDKFTVVDIDADGNVKIKDGFTKTIPAGTDVFPDNGKIKKVKRSTDFLEKEQQPELLSANETPFNLQGEEVKGKAPSGNQAEGQESQSEMFHIEEIVRENDPVKSANAAQELYGDAHAAADKLEKQLAVFDSDPANRKNFDKEQRARLKEVVALLRQRGDEKPNVATMKRPELLAELEKGGLTEINGKPVDQANPAQLMNAVFKLRKAQESGQTPTTLRTSDKLISVLEGLKLHREGQLSAATPFSLAWDAAIDTAILSIKAGRTIADAVKFGIGRLKERFPQATDDHIQKFESAIRKAYGNEAKPAEASKADTLSDKKSEYPAPVKGQPGRFYRSLPDTEREVNSAIVRQTYEKRSQAPDLAIAEEIIAQRGAAKAMEISMSKADDGVPLPVKTAIYVKLAEASDRRFIEAKTPQERATALRDRQKLSSAKSAAATEQGQGIAMYAQINKNARSGSIDEHLRNIQGEQDNQLGKDGVKAVDEVAKAMTEAKDKAIDRSTNALNKATQKTTLTKSVWQKYRDNASQRMLGLVESSVTPPKEKAPLQAFTQRIIDEVRSRIAPLLPKKPGAASVEPTPVDILKEAVDNKAKYADILTTVHQSFAEKYGEGSPAMDLIDIELANLGLKPYGDKLLDRAIKEAHKAMQTTVAAIAKDHWTKTDAKSGDLADALVRDGGLDGAEAVKVAADISERTKSLYAEERAKAVDALKRRYESTPRAKQVFNAVAKATSLNNIGALTRADVQEAVADALHLPKVKPEQLKRIADLADKVETAENPATKARATINLAEEMRKAKATSRWTQAIDTGTSVWYANMLGGTAIAVKTGGDILNSTAQMATAIAANPMHANTLVSGWLDGLGFGLERAKATLKEGKGGVGYDPLRGGYGEEGSAPYKLSGLENAKNPYTGALKYVPRTFKAIEAFFYQPAREAYAKLVATKILEGEYHGKELRQKVQEALGLSAAQFDGFTKQAVAEGFSKEDAGLRIGQLIEEHRQKNEVGTVAQSLGERFGEQAVYKQEPTGVAGIIYRILSDAVNNKVKVAGVPVLKPFLPFLKIPTNLFNESLNYTPVGAKRAFYGSRDETGNGRTIVNSDERARLLIKSVGGTLLMGGLTAMALGSGDKKKYFDISGSGPRNYDKRTQLQQTGWAPHSIKIGNTWYNYMYSPLMIPLTLVGNVADSIKYQKQREELLFSSRVADALGGATRAVFDTSMLQGLSNLMDFAKGSVTPDRFGKFLASTSTSMVVPQGVRQIDQWLSPEQHNNGALAGAIPFLRRVGPVRADMLGQPTTYSPTQRFVSEQQPDALRDVLNAKNVFVSRPSRDTKIGNRTMTDEEYEKYQKMSGQRIKSRLDSILPSLKAMTAEQAQRTVEKISRDEREKIRSVMPNKIIP